MPTNNFKALFNRSICYDRLGQFDRALADIDAALSVQPHHLGCLTNRSLIYEKLGQVDLALADINTVVRSGGPTVSSLVTRARLLGKLNMLNEAESDLEEAISMSPNDLNLLFSKGIFLKACERFEAAIAGFSTVIAKLRSGQETGDRLSEEDILSGNTKTIN